MPLGKVEKNNATVEKEFVEWLKPRLPHGYKITTLGSDWTAGLGVWKKTGLIRGKSVFKISGYSKDAILTKKDKIELAVYTDEDMDWAIKIAAEYPNALVDVIRVT